MPIPIEVAGLLLILNAGEPVMLLKVTEVLLSLLKSQPEKRETPAGSDAGGVKVVPDATGFSG